LDDDAYLTAIDIDPFDCTFNDKHSPRSKRHLHEITFVYDTTSDTDLPDTTSDTHL